MDLEQQLRMDVEAHLRSAFGDEYGGRFPESFIASVIEDVRTSSAYADGFYSHTDVKWALARTVLGLPEQASSTIGHEKNCLNCSSSFSLPTGESFDDGTVCGQDRLVCMSAHSVVSEDFSCPKHNK